MITMIIAMTMRMILMMMIGGDHDEFDSDDDINDYEIVTVDQIVHIHNSSPTKCTMPLGKYPDMSLGFNT